MKKLKNMTLVFGGIIIGVALSYSPQIYGAGAKLLGSKVTKTLEVKLNKKSIGQAAVIDGTSYLPARSLANALNVEVVSVDTKEVNLEGPEQESPPSTGDTSPVTETPEPDNSKDMSKINDLNDQIKTVKYTIASRERFIQDREKMLVDFRTAAEANPDKNNPLWNSVNATQKEITDAKADLEQQKQKLATLESQLAELQK